MKKLLILVLAMVMFFGLTGCCAKNDTNRLTLDKVVELSAKGEELTWSDFEQYESYDAGSGLYILVYEIDEAFELHIGGGALDDTPMYIRLIAKADGSCIDIRTGDVEEFIEANRE